MNSSDLIYKLLYLAFIYLRDEGRSLESKSVFHISDLFHNVPGNLNRVSKGDISGDEVLRLLRKKAIEKGCEDWLEGQIEQILSKQS